MGRATGFDPRIWGDSMVGYGQYRYKYKSGHSGEYFLTGFSPRKSAMSIYVMPGFKQYEKQLALLGKHGHSVSCLYVTRLANIDLGVLENIVADSVSRMKKLYPDWSAQTSLSGFPGSEPHDFGKALMPLPFVQPNSAR